MAGKGDHGDDLEDLWASHQQPQVLIVIEKVHKQRSRRDHEQRICGGTDVIWEDQMVWTETTSRGRNRHQEHRQDACHIGEQERTHKPHGRQVDHLSQDGAGRGRPHRQKGTTARKNNTRQYYKPTSSAGQCLKQGQIGVIQQARGLRGATLP